MASSSAGLGLARSLQAVGIALLVAEFQRIGGDLGVSSVSNWPSSKKIAQPLLGGDAHVMAGSGDHELVALQVLVEHHLAGVGVLDPEIFGHVAAAEHRIDLRPDVIGDPVHRLVLCRSSGSAVEMASLAGRSKAGGAHAPQRAPGPGRPWRLRLAASGRGTLAIALTIAVPTTTPSAEAPISLACSGVLTPKPTQTGRCGVALDARHRGASPSRCRQVPTR